MVNLHLVCIPKWNAIEPKMQRKKETSAKLWRMKKNPSWWFKPIHVDPVSQNESVLFSQGDAADLKSLCKPTEDAITQES